MADLDVAWSVVALSDGPVCARVLPLKPGADGRERIGSGCQRTCPWQDPLLVRSLVPAPHLTWRNSIRERMESDTVSRPNPGYLGPGSG